MLRFDGGGHGDVRRLHLVERAVHAVADLEVLLERLDVNIGRTVHHALVEDHVHELDDGVGVRCGVEGRDVVRVAPKRLVGVHARADGLEHVGDGFGGVSVVLRDAVVEVLLARHHEAHFLR